MRLRARRVWRWVGGGGGGCGGWGGGMVGCELLRRFARALGGSACRGSAARGRGRGGGGAWGGTGGGDSGAERCSNLRRSLRGSVGREEMSCRTARRLATAVAREWRKKAARETQSGQCQSPLGTSLSGGCKQVMWKARSQPSHSRSCSPRLVATQMRQRPYSPSRRSCSDVFGADPRCSRTVANGTCSMRAYASTTKPSSTTTCGLASSTAAVIAFFPPPQKTITHSSPALCPRSTQVRQRASPHPHHHQPLCPVGRPPGPFHSGSPSIPSPDLHCAPSTRSAPPFYLFRIILSTHLHPPFRTTFPPPPRLISLNPILHHGLRRHQPRHTPTRQQP